MSVARNIEAGGTGDTQDEVLQPGDKLLRGQYRIDRHLNSGGFGITYLARDSLDRKVVIKECFPNSMCARASRGVRARSRALQKDFETVVRHFGMEARRMAALEHPNIVGVHQVFEDYGTAYMALDFVEGQDLLDIISKDRESLTPDVIKSMLVKLLDAVQYVHEHDVLHRDISPDNILVDKTGNPVLIDFGAAREVATNASRALSALHIVKDGYSPQEFYLANHNQSPASDLYSLAATFYHLITGKAPPNSQHRLAALAADEPDPYEPIDLRTEGYDQYFLGAIDTALGVFPRDRLQSASDWLDQIDQVRRQKALRARAHKDAELDLAIRELTIETNRALEAAVRAAPPAPEPEPAPAKPKILPFADLADLDEDDDPTDEDDPDWSETDDWDEDEDLPVDDDEPADEGPQRPARRLPLWLRLFLLPFKLLRFLFWGRRKGSQTRRRAR